MRRKNKLAMYVGGVLTAVTMAVLFVVPLIVPVETINRSVYELTGQVWTGNPFLQLRLFASVPGALVTGYLAKDRLGNNDWMTSFKYGALSAVVGLTLLYVLYFVARTGYAVFVLWSVPAFYIIFVFPLILGLPLVPAGLFFGAFAGLLGNVLSLYRE